MAAQYGLQDFEKWADRELEGYDKDDPSQLPDYRWLCGGEVPVYYSIKHIEFCRFEVAGGSSIKVENADGSTVYIKWEEFEPLLREVTERISKEGKKLRDQNINAGTGDVTLINSTAGPINTGQQIGNQIDVRIGSLRENNKEVAEAFEAIKNEIAADKKLTEQQQTEILQMLNLLAGQASLPQQQRQRGIIKPILTGLAANLSAGGGAAEIWNTAGPIIKGFFGYKLTPSVSLRKRGNP